MEINSPDIFFPNLNIEFAKVNREAFSVFGVSIYWYGVIIMCGIIAGLLLARFRAKRSDQDPDIYTDFLFYALISAIVGARLFYVIFAFDEYRDNLMKVFAFREGGLAIYGGVIGAVIALLVYTRRKKLNFMLMADTAAPGLILGQIIGRFGNFVNMEAFGGPSDNLFAMAIKASKARVPQSMVQYITEVEGYAGSYLVVQPTFLYEASWNVMILIIMLVHTKYKKFDGEIFMLYLAGYGVGRAIIEGFRTDQLIIGDTGIPVSQLLAAILVVVGTSVIIYKRSQVKKEEDKMIR